MAVVFIVYHKNEVVGLVTSGGYGYRLRQSIELACVRTDLAVAGIEPLYDPQNLRLRG